MLAYPRQFPINVKENTEVHSGEEAVIEVVFSSAIIEDIKHVATVIRDPPLVSFSARRMKPREQSPSACFFAGNSVATVRKVAGDSNGVFPD